MASLRYVVRNLARRKGRTLLGALGILLTIALLTAIHVGIDSISVSYVDLVSVQAGKADLVVSAEGGSSWKPKGFDAEEVLKKLGEDRRIEGFSPRLFGLCQVKVGKTDRFALLIGIDPKRERTLDLAGLRPEPTLAEGTCALSDTLTRSLDARAGEEAAVSYEGGAETRLRIECEVERQMILPQQARDYIVTDLGSARRILGERRQVHMLAAAFHDARAAYDASDLHGSVLRLKHVGAGIAEALGPTFSVRLPRATAIEMFEELTTPLRAVFGVFAVLALAITGLLIYSILSMSVEERVHEYAILRTLGAKRRDIFSLVLVESAILCLVGVLPGVPGGAFLAKGILAIVSHVIGGMGGEGVTLEISASTLWMPLVAGAVLAITSALIPAMHAVKWTIVDALDPLRRGQVRVTEPSEGAPNRALFLAGLALTSISVVVFFVLPSALLSGDPSLIGTVILCLLLTILLGLTLIGVAAMPLVERMVLFLTRWAFGPVAEMARRNLVRHARRHTTTAVMFTLSVSFVLFVSSLVALFARTAIGLIEQVNGADLRVFTDERSDHAKSDLSKVGDVRAVTEILSLRGRSSKGMAFDVSAEDLIGMKHLWVRPFGVDADLARVLYMERIQWTEGGPKALEVLADDAGKVDYDPPVIVSASTARVLDVQRGDVVNLSFRLGTVKRDARFRIEAVCASMPGFPNVRARIALAHGSGVLMSEASFLAMTKDAPKEAVQANYLVRAEPDRGEEVGKTIREEFGLKYRFGVVSTDEEKRRASGVYWGTQVLFGVLLAVAVTVAVFALIASTATSVVERRWEIGVLSALGLRRGQLFRLFLAETMVLTLSAGLCGGAIGFGLAYMFILQASVLVEMPILFTMPYITFASTFVISIASGAVAAWLPTRRLLRKPAAEILRLGD